MEDISQGAVRCLGVSLSTRSNSGLLPPAREPLLLLMPCIEGMCVMRISNQENGDLG